MSSEQPQQIDWVVGALIAADPVDPLCNNGKSLLLSILVPKCEVQAGPVEVRFPKTKERTDDA